MPTRTRRRWEMFETTIQFSPRKSGGMGFLTAEKAGGSELDQTVQVPGLG